MVLWLILEAGDLRVLEVQEVQDMEIMLASGKPVMLIILASVGLFMVTLAMLELELELAVELEGV